MLTRLLMALALWMEITQVRGWAANPIPGRSALVAASPIATTVMLMSDVDDDGYGFDEEVARNPTEEIARLKAKIEVAKEEGDMDTVLTLMGTLLALGGGYDSEE